ncbi:zinc finger, CCHC-type, Retrotransposon gag domain protein [Artemisia annua]|uniref:Zinc finger, CCHC-type, Retrotransposon gag domain protein n=1 Tax=Artemisia annua TaxID=35608 RepID=A0A2U1QHB3_ARTAN|nr:zinc finger, CCHC-type, Retrotransposon gag domain protein [Artemisia annua]
MENAHRNGDVGDIPNFKSMIAAALANVLLNLSTELSAQITNNIRNGAGSSGGGSSVPPTEIHVWIERFNNLKPLAFRSAVTPTEAEDWIIHIEKLFQVLGCADKFKTRLAAFKLEGDALTCWKAYLQTQVGGETFADTCAWATFREIFHKRYFPVSEQQRYEREYGSIYQLETENSVEYMQRFMRLASLVGSVAGDDQRQTRHFKLGLKRWVLDRIVNNEYTDVAQVCAAAHNIELLNESSSSNKRNIDGERIQDKGSGQQDRSVDHRGRDDKGGDQKGQNVRRQESRGRDQKASNRKINNRKSYFFNDQRSWRDGELAQRINRDTRSRDQEQKQDQKRISQCVTCGKYHRGVCNRLTNACFSCGSMDHKIKDCLKHQVNRYNKKARKDKQNQSDDRAIN